MKKTILTSVLVLGVIGGAAAWFASTPEPYLLEDFVQIGIIIILVLFAIILVSKRIGSMKDGLPPEDELSKRMIKLAAARSYYMSLYLWLFLMYASTEKIIETESTFSVGILGMAVLLGINWFIVKLTGLKNE